VPLRDNGFVLRALRARFPVRLVAYDREGRIVGIEKHPATEGYSQRALRARASDRR
jgi:hypothetical protein